MRALARLPRVAVLLLGLFVPCAASAYQDRIEASVARLALTAEERPAFQRLLEEHYASLKSMYQRQVRQLSGHDLEKQVRRGVDRINGRTAERMEQVLRPEQMPEVRYLLELIGRQFKSETGLRE